MSARMLIQESSHCIQVTQHSPRGISPLPLHRAAAAGSHIAARLSRSARKHGSPMITTIRGASNAGITDVAQTSRGPKRHTPDTQPQEKVYEQQQILVRRPTIGCHMNSTPKNGTTGSWTSCGSCASGCFALQRFFTNTDTTRCKNGQVPHSSVFIGAHSQQGGMRGSIPQQVKGQGLERRMPKGALRQSTAIGMGVWLGAVWGVGLQQPAAAAPTFVCSSRGRSGKNGRAKRMHQQPGLSS